MRMIVALLIFGTAALAQGRQPAATTGATVVSETLALQVMLDRAGFSPGEIDGRAGANLQRAVSAFQRAHGLADSGQADDGTWQQLTKEAAGQAPLATYDITAADLKGPFVEDIPADLMAQAALEALSYRSLLEAIAERFHASPGLLRRLNPDASFTTVGERVRVPNVEPFELPSPSSGPARGRGRGAAPDRSAVTIVVTKSTSALTVEDATGRVLFHAPVTSGSEHDPLPIGTWKVTGVQRLPAFHYNPDLFWDASPAHSKARIAPGPNNPVGIAWIDLSKEHYGIHGTPEPSRIAYVQSHGCVRLTNWDAARVLQWARTGVPVVFRE